ncbi:unnamed protein product, partial [Prorocentrum cordatum]
GRAQRGGEFRQGAGPEHRGRALGVRGARHERQRRARGDPVGSAAPECGDQPRWHRRRCRYPSRHRPRRQEDEIRSTLEHPAPAAPAAAQPAAAPAAQAAAVPAEPVPGLLMELKNVQAEAELHAGKALAEVFARTATKALEARSQDASKAEKLEKA